MNKRSTNKNVTVAALLASVAMSALEATVVGTAMPTVIADVGGLDRYGWVAAAYTLASTVSMPLYGTIADRSGRRPTLIFGIVLFLIGSFASGSSTSMNMLIGARALQGLGAGAMQPIALTIIGDLFTLEQRGRVQAMLGAVWGISGMAGPLVGGLIVSTVGWRWVFWSNLPLGLISIGLLIYAYHETIASKVSARIDILGAFILTASSIGLLLGAQRIYPILTVPLSLVGLAAFLWVESVAETPVLPLAMLRRRAVAVAGGAGFALGASMMSAVLFLPLFVQAVLGRSATEAGATIAPMLVGWPLAAAAGSRLFPRIGFRRPVIAGAGLVWLCLIAMAFLVHPDVSLWQLRIVMFFYGLGMGLTLTAQLLAVQSGVDASERGIATATNLFARSMGGALGAGAFGAMFSASLGRSVSVEQATALLDPLQRAAATTAPVRAALATGLEPIFVASAALGMVAFVFGLFYPADSNRSVPTNEPSIET